MNEELITFAKNNIQSIVPLPKGKHSVGNHWVFKTKFNFDGLVDRYETRLIAQGFTYKFIVDHKETFAPVSKMTILRVLLPVVSYMDGH